MTAPGSATVLPPAMATKVPSGRCARVSRSFLARPQRAPEHCPGAGARSPRGGPVLTPPTRPLYQRLRFQACDLSAISVAELFARTVS